MTADRITTIDAEAPFRPEELSFSRTDKRGIIQSGNSTFQRISLYAWEELLKAPHKLIRHPDMPRGVFQIFWDTIKAGKPIGAYVVNRARDGRYYWVFAVVSPTDDGYLSVRLKPTSDMLKVVQQLYAAALARERRESLTPEDSATAILGALADLGFPTYDSFMAVALARESAARDAALGRVPDGRASYLSGIVTKMIEARSKAATIATAFATIDLVPYNMRLQSARLGDASGPMNVIATNYKSISSDMQYAVEDFATTLDGVLEAIAEALFLQATARLQAEVSRLFGAGDDVPEAIETAAESRRLESQRDQFAASAERGLAGLSSSADALQRAHAQMRRMTNGLQVTRVMCKIECARIAQDAGSLSEIVDQLGVFQGTIEQALSVIEGVSDAIRGVSARRAA